MGGARISQFILGSFVVLPCQYSFANTHVLRCFLHLMRGHLVWLPKPVSLVPSVHTLIELAREFATPVEVAGRLFLQDGAHHSSNIILRDSAAMQPVKKYRIVITCVLTFNLYGLKSLVPGSALVLLEILIQSTGRCSCPQISQPPTPHPGT